MNIQINQNDICLQKERARSTSSKQNAIGLLEKGRLDKRDRECVCIKERKGAILPTLIYENGYLDHQTSIP